MIFLIGFLLMADTTWATGNFGGRLSIKLPSLGALNLGYTNPALAEGLGGCGLNPAALSGVKGKKFSTAVGFSSKVGMNFNPVIDMGEELDLIVEIPCEVSFTQPMSMNLVSFGANLGDWVIGIGFMEEFGVGVSLDGNGIFAYRFNDTIPDTLTHADIPDIPEGDTIPIELIFRSPLELSLIADGNLDYSESRLFLGVARASEGRLKAGVGIAYRPIRGKFSTISIANASAPCTLECRAIHPEWTIDGVGTTQIDEDILEAGASGELRGDEFNFLAGMILDLGFLKLGGTLEAVPRTTLTFEGGAGWTYINDIPSDVEIDTFDVVVDSDSQIVRGTIGVTLPEFPDTTERDTWENKFELAGKVGITVGGAIELGPFTAGLSVGANSLEEFSFSGEFESRLFFPLRTNFELINKVYQINGEKFWIPYIVMGIGSSLRIRNLSLDFGLRTNSFHTVASLVETVEDEQLPKLFELFSPVIGINLKFE